MAFDLIANTAGRFGLVLRCDNVSCLKPIQIADHAAKLIVVPDGDVPYVTACCQACADRIVDREGIASPISWIPLVPAVGSWVDFFAGQAAT
jgi:hypothetical protein